MAKCMYCGKPTKKNRSYCSDGCKTMYNNLLRGVKLQESVLADPAKALEGIPSPAVERKSMDTLDFYWIVTGGLRRILDFGKHGRSPLFLLNVKPGDVVKIKIEVTQRS